MVKGEKMTKNEFENSYWKQYLALEKEFINIGRYITIEPDNYHTYSVMLQKFILEVGSEIDNVMKELCDLVGKENITISEYYEPITTEFPNLTNQEIVINGYEIKPFDGWNASQPSKSLKFWNKYNSIKHNRITNKKEASLETAIMALGGLFILEMYEINRIYLNDSDVCTNFPTDNSESELFKLNNWKMRIRTSKIDTPYPVFDDDTGEQIA